jgi:hypothetical protein
MPANFFLQAHFKEMRTLPDKCFGIYRLTKPRPKRISKTRRANNKAHFYLATTVYSSCCICSNYCNISRYFVAR